MVGISPILSFMDNPLSPFTDLGGRWWGLNSQNRGLAQLLSYECFLCFQGILTFIITWISINATRSLSVVTATLFLILLY